MSYCDICWYTPMKIEGIQARINQNGRIVIPAVIRKGMGLKLGDSVIMSLEDGALRIEPHLAPHRARVRRAKDEFRRIAEPETSDSSDLAQVRPGESQAEMEDWLG